MDFNTFNEQLSSEDLKPLKSAEKQKAFITQKYPDGEIIGAYWIKSEFTVVLFKQKLWNKLAFFASGEWIETRIAALKTTVPDNIADELSKIIKKNFTILKVESVITPDGAPYLLYHNQSWG